MVVERSEIIFRGRVMDARRCLVILKGESVILGNELAVFVEIAKIEFGVGIILRGGRAEPLECGAQVVGGRIAVKDEPGETILGSGIAAFGARLKIGPCAGRLG